MANAVLAATVLSACATQPTRNDQLEEARVAGRSLEQDPDAQGRAQAVASALKTEGISIDRIQPVGRGETIRSQVTRLQPGDSKFAGLTSSSQTCPATSRDEAPSHASTQATKEKPVPRFMTIVCLLLLAPAAVLHAQEPRPAGADVIEASAGNSVLQVRYLTPSPLTGMPSDLDYGFLLSEGRDMIASAALMFHTNLHPIPRLTLEVGPQGYLALLSAQQKTDVTAVAFGAAARYEILRRWGLAAFGSSFYSPGVLTFGSAHNLYDFTAGGEIHFTPRLTGQAGYRWLKFTTVGEPDLRVQNELFAGLSWRLGPRR